jgi:hypothetical protein
MRPRKRQGRTIKTEGQRYSGITSSDFYKRMFEMRAINYGAEDIEILRTTACKSALIWPPFPTWHGSVVLCSWSDGIITDLI